jgi:hypothetical protein
VPCLGVRAPGISDPAYLARVFQKCLSDARFVVGLGAPGGLLRICLMDLATC